MNPARTFGPDLVGADFNAYWVYLAGPLAGAVVAAGTAWSSGSRRRTNRSEPHKGPRTDRTPRPGLNGPQRSAGDETPRPDGVLRHAVIVFVLISV